MEELLKQIVARLDRMEKGQQTIREEVGILRQEQQTIREEVGILRQEQRTIQEEVGILRQEQQTIREEVSNMSSQLDENTAIIKAIRHNQEFANAKLDGLVVSTVSKESLTNLATKEDIAELAANFEVLNARLFQNEVEVQRLKAVK